jgi:hypothetical protein
MLEDVGCALSFSTVTNCHTKLDAIAPTKDFQERFHPEHLDRKTHAGSQIARSNHVMRNQRPKE